MRLVAARLENGCFLRDRLSLTRLAFCRGACVFQPERRNEKVLCSGQALAGRWVQDKRKCFTARKTTDARFCSILFCSVLGCELSRMCSAPGSLPLFRVSVSFIEFSTTANPTSWHWEALLLSLILFGDDPAGGCLDGFLEVFYRRRVAPRLHRFATAQTGRLCVWLALRASPTRTRLQPLFLFCARRARGVLATNERPAIPVVGGSRQGSGLDLDSTGFERSGCLLSDRKKTATGKKPGRLGRRKGPPTGLSVMTVMATPAGGHCVLDARSMCA